MRDRVGPRFPLARPPPGALGRRRVLVAGAGLLALGPAACWGGAGPDRPLENADGSCNHIPPEVAGPFPADGTNGPNVLSLDDVVRRDIRSSIGDRSGTAEGAPLTLRLSLVDGACAPVVGAAVYLWHCDALGDYSLYNVEDQNYLRGVQVSGDDGAVEFVTVFPGCYLGRWPHAHVEVFASLDAASTGREAISTSQLAFPEEACAAVYARAEYGGSGENLERIGLDADTAFDDGTARQMVEVSEGSTGLLATLTLAV